MEKNDGYVVEMGATPGRVQRHQLLCAAPYGVWLVISPFNFPFA
jgi:acyl-CoA reductase-like NAD-dependent aldehyde dehydrogenase